ncbi:unnamed protein product [Rotaria sordida]|uniref:diacylglycerol cholinephosphotransferase n=1 Tax=Rotaria sordida TaxID=392033 RepID=A0A813WLM6_9BILA|nr:unnamed protein product [Rotaria sordida]CAF0863207.1 unnamed protein product [Rotaria sordida]
MSVRMSANLDSHKDSASLFHDNVKQIKEQTDRLEANARKAIQCLPSVLNEQQIKRLKEHKYASEGTTLVDPYMQKFWKRLVEYCPLWVAPNLITIVGLVINIGTSVLLMYLTNGAKEPCTRWMYFFTALGLFIYQSLDAIDGKQARRTNSSTPLGELFDHGCDSVSTVFVTLATCCAVQLGLYPWTMFWCCMTSYVTFYCAHWQTYVSGKLKFGKIDCTEAQWTFITIYLISSIAPNFWSTTVPIINIEARILAGLLAVGSAVWSSANNILIISKGGCGRNFSSVAGTSIIFPVWHIGFLIFLAFIASNYSISHSLKEHTALHLTCYGIVFSKITNRLIIAHMSKSPLDTWDTAYYGPVAVCVNQYFNCCIKEDIFLWIFLIYSLYDLLRYNIKVCQELCDALNIYCFQIEPPTTSTSDGSH